MVEGVGLPRRVGETDTCNGRPVPAAPTTTRAPGKATKHFTVPPPSRCWQHTCNLQRVDRPQLSYFFVESMPRWLASPTAKRWKQRDEVFTCQIDGPDLCGHLALLYHTFSPPRPSITMSRYRSRVNGRQRVRPAYSLYSPHDLH